MHRLAALLSLLLLAGGCGGGEKTVTEEDKILGAADMSDMVSSPETFKSRFVDGAVPDESQRERYKGLSFGASDPSISGNSATMTVTIRDVSTWKVVGEEKWTAEKVGETWKLKTAPLPEDLP